MGKRKGAFRPPSFSFKISLLHGFLGSGGSLVNRIGGSLLGGVHSSVDGAVNGGSGILHGGLGLVNSLGGGLRGGIHRIGSLFLYIAPAGYEEGCGGCEHRELPDHPCCLFGESGRKCIQEHHSLEKNVNPIG
ncbi:MAG: hypothetical protein KDB93_13150 [Flavobacteriales bacterium]|nr:hypothetical protein [Flavobacteriales bacterium]